MKNFLRFIALPLAFTVNITALDEAEFKAQAIAACRERCDLDFNGRCSSPIYNFGPFAPQCTRGTIRKRTPAEHEKCLDDCGDCP